MDNLTHSVVGLGVGALIDRSLPPEADLANEHRRTRLLLTVCCLASNFPDLDLVLTPLLDAPLGYLLHHRGHTHTVLAAIGEAALLLGLVWLLWPAARQVLRDSRHARRGAVFAAGAGLLLHLCMDGLNVYGVHPFWPFDPRWYYGDLVFIVEPVFWIAFGVPLAAMVKKASPRRLLLAAMALVPLGFTLGGFLQWGSLLGLLALGLVLAWIQRHVAAPAIDALPGGAADANRTAVHRPPRRRAGLVAGLVASLAFVAIQAGAMHEARGIIAAQLQRSDAGERLRDIALSAYPANPLCWSFVTVGEDAAGGSYRLRRGLLSIAPGVTAVSACPARIAGPAAGRSAADAETDSVAVAGLAWQSDERHSLATLRTLARDDCHVGAWMRFARAPSFDGGLATDVRWGPPGSRNFSTMDVAAMAHTPCPSPVPGWGMPRADLLGQR
ncbi:metal-dependent hydrolase [Massilia sp. TN1-12]|uniref:metal-dependent hydrolase n=1 Tax=Massilia paldalensis TaxID=3377675 RepID=UPI00384E6B85